MTEQETVILLHGLARSSRSMNKLQTALQQAGYHTLNIDYPSTRHTIEALSKDVIGKALARCPSATKIHFVTHSLGGILLRHYLMNHRIDKLGRVVMLAPPNQGSQLADWLQAYRLYQYLFGPVGMQLGTASSSLIQRLGPADFELGIIAGTRAINLLFSPILPKPNDGTVTVENTKLKGMKTHLSVPASHPFIMRKQRVIDEVIRFLQDGCFNG